MPTNGLWEMLNGPAPESQLWGQIKNAWNNPNQQALLGFGGGAQNGNDVGLFGKLVAPIPGMDPLGKRAEQGLPEAVANTAHTLSPHGLFDMAHGVYDAANRLTTPVDDNRGYQEHGDSYVPYNGTKKVVDAFNVASVMPVGGLLASGARGAESGAASIPKDAYGQLTKYVETPNGAKQAEMLPPEIPGLFGAKVGSNIDNLGYYSGALEAAKVLPQAKGTPEQMLAMLKKGGAKQAEIEATNLGQFLDGKTSVTRDEMIHHLETNRAGLNEVKYGSGKSPAWADAIGSIMDRLPETVADRFSRSSVFNAAQREATNSYENSFAKQGFAGEAKWPENSLDPSNKTYQETVLHLPLHDIGDTKRALQEAFNRGDLKFEEFVDAYKVAGLGQKTNFNSGHFPETNITGHMMTSMTRHEGKPVFTLDQIQSDWGQKLRNGGVRDEAKITDLKQRREELNRQYDAIPTSEKFLPDQDGHLEQDGQLVRISDKAKSIANERDLVRAEIHTAEASASGHPLVNTTDQWTNTTLRRAINQAVESGADHIAIPHGDTVLSYNPGDTNGMRGFYGSRDKEGIVPKNLRKILSGYDKDSPPPIRVTELETPSGKRGWKKDGEKDFDQSQTGFTLFPLTEKAKTHVRKNGQPLFSNPATAAPLAGLLSQDDQQLPGIFGGPR